MPACELLDAAAQGNATELQQFLKDGVSPDACNIDGLTALHQVCIDDRADLAEMLIATGANIEACDKECWTPLHAAASAGSINALRVLLDHGANVAAMTLDNQTALEVANEACPFLPQKKKKNKDEICVRE